MKITEFSKELSVLEGGKEQVNIAQIAEINKNIDEMFGGFFYYLIRNDLHTNKTFQKIVKIMVKICFKKNKDWETIEDKFVDVILKSYLFLKKGNMLK